jgi:hypothetical protein
LTSFLLLRSSTSRPKSKGALLAFEWERERVGGGQATAEKGATETSVLGKTSRSHAQSSRQTQVQQQIAFFNCRKGSDKNFSFRQKQQKTLAVLDEDTNSTDTRQSFFKTILSNAEALTGMDIDGT